MPERTRAQEVFERLAYTQSRRSFIGRASAVFAWLVGVQWVPERLYAWSPNGDGLLPRLGFMAFPPPATTYGQPHRPPPPTGTGPPGNVGGTGDGCTRKSSAGMHGTDCRCMYGANACPAGSSQPAGAAWCACVDVAETAGTPPTMHEICYIDCFSPSGGGSVNTYGRSCSCTGNAPSPPALPDDGQTWPRGEDAEGAGSYVCTIEIDLGYSSTWEEPTHTFPANYAGTAVTEHEVLRTIETHEDIRDLVLPPEYS